MYRRNRPKPLMLPPRPVHPIMKCQFRDENELYGEYCTLYHCYDEIMKKYDEQQKEVIRLKSLNERLMNIVTNKYRPMI